jgi:hypothetical protein
MWNTSGGKSTKSLIAELTLSQNQIDISSGDSSAKNQHLFSAFPFPEAKAHSNFTAKCSLRQFSSPDSEGSSAIFYVSVPHPQWVSNSVP